MNLPTTVYVMAGLCLLNALFWWQEARKERDTLSVRGRNHRRLTVVFGVLAVFLSFAFR